MRSGPSGPRVRQHCRLRGLSGAREAVPGSNVGETAERGIPARGFALAFEHRVESDTTGKNKNRSLVNRYTMTLKTIETTFDIINILIELDGARVTELAERMDRPTSTIHDYLKALNEGGYVVKEGQTYRVSSRFLYFGQRARNQREIYDAAREQVENLAAETGEYASLMVEEQGYGILLYTLQGEKAVDIDTPDGVRTKLHATAMGKCILANLPEERVRAILEEHGLDERTPHTVTDEAELFEHLEEIREQGYAIDEEEQFEGMEGIAAPIMGMSGNVRGAVGVYGPIGRTGDPSEQERIREAVSEAVNVIEVSLKYPSDYP